MYEIKLDQFSGPLDLLLQLIEKQELDISRISIAQVTNEFLEYLDKFKEERPSEIADFLYFASKLIYLKSIILLPYINQEDEEEILKLERELTLYKEFREATKNIRKILASGNILFSREKFFLTDTFFIPPKNVNVRKIFEIFKEIIKYFQKEYMIVERIRKKTFSVAKKIEELKNILLKKQSFDFISFVKNIKFKMEIVISFLAILETARRGMIKLRQEKIFGEIKIFKTNSKS